MRQLVVGRQSGGHALLVVHGGAGPIRAELVDSIALAERRAGLRQALAAGWRVLKSGGAALDAVQEAVRALEEHPRYNAGRGSVLDALGVVEMDASLMCGRDRRAGALCGARRLRNPILGARRLLEDGRVFVQARAVESWLEEQGLELKEPGWFITEERVRQLEAARGTGRSLLDHAGEALDGGGDDGGTVGAAARDSHGHLAAGTSTGGMTNKAPGRIGDSPVIGAGTWADDTSVALSATGEGEAFIRSVFAHEVEARVRLAGEDLAQAVGAALARVVDCQGEGGCVALGQKEGVLAWNTQGMYRGWVDASTGRWGLAIFDEEELEGGTVDQLDEP